MPADPWYITTAIPYVNAVPHLGFALEAVLTDAFARYRRLAGRDVWFLTGTDDNSLKNVQAAEEAGVPVREFVHRTAAAFEGLRAPLDLSFDDFIRTSSDPRHGAGVEKLWRACDASGDLYRKPYRGLYCVGCEQFYGAGELVGGKCPEHGTVPDEIEEENWFFRLSRYQAQLLELIENDTLRIIPTSRKNEVTSFIRSGLEDFSVSRSQQRARGWGIPIPDDADQVMYVWFDALGNYITALDYAHEGERYQRYWRGSPDRVHVIGKGIIRFHAVYWPAMLLSAGVPLPTHIFVHGYITINGEKISKSLGNVIDPVALSERYGVDTLRYFLLRHIRPTGDGDFTIDALERAHNADLADQLGNLVSRVVSMIARYYDGLVPEPAGDEEEPMRALRALAVETPGQVHTAMEAFAPNDALQAIWNLVSEANRAIVLVEPWVLAKSRDADARTEERLATVLHHLAEVIRLTAHLLLPFIPGKAVDIAGRVGVTPADAWGDALTWSTQLAGQKVEPGEPLFPKLVP
jgi:methionyl-tRNA synthetase